MLRNRRVSMPPIANNGQHRTTTPTAQKRQQSKVTPGYVIDVSKHTMQTTNSTANGAKAATAPGGTPAG
jgi:hypothetical protein